jgi:hypothetical protein
MQKPVIATSLSAIAIFAAGLVAGQLGAIPVSFAANTPGVGAFAGSATVANGFLTTPRYALDHRSSARFVGPVVHAISGSCFTCSKRGLSTTSTVPVHDPRVVPGGPRGPTDQTH